MAKQLERLTEPTGPGAGWHLEQILEDVQSRVSTILHQTGIHFLISASIEQKEFSAPTFFR